MSEKKPKEAVKDYFKEFDRRLAEERKREQQRQENRNAAPVGGKRYE